MRILGVDFGEKRVGLAVSDELYLLARELEIVSPSVFFQRLPHLVQEYELAKIVLGLPLTLSGTHSKKTDEIIQAGEKIAQISGVEVVYMDERLSSHMAQQMPGGYTAVDSLAAQIILQNYLDKQKQTHE